ncbi:MAG: hypothetical protein ABI778_02255 [Ignavibacteriota bacterium]
MFFIEKFRIFAAMRCEPRQRLWIALFKIFDEGRLYAGSSVKKKMCVLCTLMLLNCNDFQGLNRKVGAFLGNLSNGEIGPETAVSGGGDWAAFLLALRHPKPVWNLGVAKTGYYGQGMKIIDNFL